MLFIHLFQTYVSIMNLINDVSPGFILLSLLGEDLMVQSPIL